jgi:hypothetical protein
MTVNDSLYEKKPRHYALELVIDGIVTAQDLLTMCLNAMSHDEVKEMLDANELSPRFLNDDDEDDGMLTDDSFGEEDEDEEI